MDRSYTIRPIQAEEIEQARRLIYGVGRDLFHPEMTMEQATTYWDERGTLRDLEDIQKNYVENGGVFLVMVADGPLIGTGAFCRAGDGICELKRLWFLPRYQGRGLGYAMLKELIRRARDMGYTRMRLLTDRYSQPRAVAFYHQVGFEDITVAGAEVPETAEEDLWMEMAI